MKFDIKPFKKIEAPALDVDKRMAELGSPQTSVHARLERRVVANLINFLGENGWTPCEIGNFDHPEDYPITDMKSAMEMIFNLDEAYIYFKNDAGRKHYVFFVRGNSPEELISDWSYARNEDDSFNAVMEAFNPEEAI